MGRRKLVTAQDLFEVRDKRNLSETEQSAIVDLYGYSLPNRRAWEQPFTPASRWRDKWHIDPAVIRMLYNRGLVERESIGTNEWNIRLTGRAFLNVIPKA